MNNDQDGILKSNLSTIMGQRKLKIADMMKLSGVSRGSINRLYHETPDMKGTSLDILMKCCDALDISLDELVTYYPTPKNKD